MKRVLLIISLFVGFTSLYSQNYKISFGASGAGQTVDSVLVNNITQCSKLQLKGSDTLLLTSSQTGIDELLINSDNSLQIYPNPIVGSCHIKFFVPVSSITKIEIIDLNGESNLVLNELLQEGLNSFELNGLINGTYLVNIKSDYFSYCGKIISLSNEYCLQKITIKSYTFETDNKNKHNKINHDLGLKVKKSLINMPYNKGDRLKITGKSGNNRTIFMLVPENDQTLTFNFVNCADADSNHYSVVQIGTQFWMAENLKTTKYRDGSIIPNVPDSAKWGSLKSGAYSDYHNLSDEGNVYGHLYNWFAVADSHNISPVGWHVSSDSEWTVLINYLGGDSTAGGKLKENCTTRWASPNTGATNESGFTGLCTNFRNVSGAWSLAPNNDHDGTYWTSTEYMPGKGWALAKGLRYCYEDVFLAPVMKGFGFSIRCIKD